MPSTEPKSVKVDRSGGTGMKIEWNDGHSSAYSFQYLRDACPCATCDDEREKTGDVIGKPPKPKGGIPMYKEPARPAEVTQVGRYAISFSWNDGHNNGIYSWQFLRTYCPCAECAAQRENAGS